jgi:hypothetical protein
MASGRIIGAGFGNQNANRSGVETSRRGTVNFKLGSVQTSTTPWDTAYGNVVSEFLERGAFVTMVLVVISRQRLNKRSGRHRALRDAGQSRL